MDKTITVTNLANSREVHDFKLSIPSHCPCCNSTGDFRLLNAYYLKSGTVYNTDVGSVYAMFFCQGCEECFIAYYDVEIRIPRYESTGLLVSLAPRKHQSKTIFSDEINGLSPNFVKIYHQSEKAEYDGLDEICGIGYRKALEFLIKDFAILIHPDQADKIAKANLSQCLTDYIDNEKVQNLAKASTWLGNDETHYIRKHEKYGIESFKLFLQATVAAIDLSLTCSKAEAFLSAPK